MRSGQFRTGHRRVLVALTITVLVAALAGCATEPTDGVTPAVDETSSPVVTVGSAGAYPIVDTGQTVFYDARTEIAAPEAGEAFFGQDAQSIGNTPSYTDNGDGTVSDDVTGLMWAQSPDLTGDGVIDIDDKLSYAEALAGADDFALAGYDDWRLPTIKELYSLMDFSGTDPSGVEGADTSGMTPFIDTEYFEFGYGDPSGGERIIDAQFASATTYVSTTMDGAATMFGLNLADGRIKGYPAEIVPGRGVKGYYVLYVRGSAAYGLNDFVDNSDGTITDQATGLMWAQEDSGVGMDWESALAYAAQMNAERYLGHDDWRVPDVKELQSLVDYTRAPDVTGSAAIDLLFSATEITNEAGQSDWACYWSSTTHANLSDVPGGNAAYVAFGRALGYMNGRWTDVHGAGAQRSDPKTGDASAWPTGHGPQGDAIRIENFVRLVRDAG